MDERERQKLVEKRKRELEEKTLENDIAQKLHLQQQENEIKAISETEQNRFVEATIIFLGTLAPLYLFIFIPYWISTFLWGTDLSKIGLHIGALIPYLHAAIWLVSIISIYRKKSLLDSFFDYFSN